VDGSDDGSGDFLFFACCFVPPQSPLIWCNIVIAITHNAKAFDSQFILRRAILLKCKSELILKGLKIISTKMQHSFFRFCFITTHAFT
jgi:ethanolamine transporter EutH